MTNGLKSETKTNGVPKNAIEQRVKLALASDRTIEIHVVAEDQNRTKWTFTEIRKS